MEKPHLQHAGGKWQIATWRPRSTIRTISHTRRVRTVGIRWIGAFQLALLAQGTFRQFFIALWSCQIVALMIGDTSTGRADCIRIAYVTDQQRSLVFQSCKGPGQSLHTLTCLLLHSRQPFRDLVWLRRNGIASPFHPSMRRYESSALDQTAYTLIALLPGGESI